jgi:Protein kinase domain/SLBB domain
MPSTSSTPASCPRCHQAIPADSAPGVCPACLLAAGFFSQPAADTSAAPPPSLAELAPEFPQLELIELLGRGGMGAVYKARQPHLDRLVALKLLRTGLDADPSFAERFTREARALAQLNHPGIVTLHEFGRTPGGLYFIVMEFVDGVNLRQLLAAGRLAPREALAIVPPLCDALQYAHDHGLVHRDIKPENILVDRLGRVKIADFGLAKLAASPGSDSAVVTFADTSPTARPSDDLTEAGKVMGTPRYMAPEQREQPAAVDHRADIYALGVVLYQMLTGELPDEKQLQPPSRRVQIDVRLDEIVLRALEKDPSLRFANATEFKTRLETFGAGELAQRSNPAAAPSLPARFVGFEYKSQRTLFGLPLLHIAKGIDLATGRPRIARGFIAIGGVAQGVFAFGGISVGVFAFGGVGIGIFGYGGVAIGLFSMGGLGLAALACFAGFALAPLAVGGLAVGWYAYGAQAYGQYVSAVRRHDVAAETLFGPWLQVHSDHLQVINMVLLVSGFVIMLGVPWLVRRRLEARAEAEALPATGSKQAGSVRGDYLRALLQLAPLSASWWFCEVLLFPKWTELAQNPTSANFADSLVIALFNPAAFWLLPALFAFWAVAELTLPVWRRHRRTALLATTLPLNAAALLALLCLAVSSLVLAASLRTYIDRRPSDRLATPAAQIVPRATANPDYAKAYSVFARIMGLGEALGASLEIGDVATSRDLLAQCFSQIRDYNRLTEGTSLVMPRPGVALLEETDEALKSGDVKLASQRFSAALAIDDGINRYQMLGALALKRPTTTPLPSPSAEARPPDISASITFVTLPVGGITEIPIDPAKLSAIPGVEVLSAPGVTTQSGRECEISVQQSADTRADDRYAAAPPGVVVRLRPTLEGGLVKFSVKFTIVTRDPTNPAHTTSEDLSVAGEGRPDTSLLYPLTPGAGQRPRAVILRFGLPSATSASQTITSTTTAVAPTPASGSGKRLLDLALQLAVARNRYGARHPSLISLETEFAALEKQMPDWRADEAVRTAAAQEKSRLLAERERQAQRFLPAHPSMRELQLQLDALEALFGLAGRSATTAAPDAFDSMERDPAVLKIQLAAAEAELGTVTRRVESGSAPPIDKLAAVERRDLLAARLADDRVAFVQAQHRYARAVLLVATMLHDTGQAAESEVVAAKTAVDLAEARLRTLTAPPSNRITVNVLGAVARPGAYPLPADASLLDVLAAAGGWSRTADWSVVTLTGDAPADVGAHNLASILDGQAINPRLSDHAIVLVPSR